MTVGFGIVLDAIEAHGDMNAPLPEGPSFFQFSDPDTCRRALLDAGFAEPRVETVPLVWKLASPEMFFRAIHEGSVRTRALLRAQAPKNLEAIRRTIGEKVKSYEKDGVTEIPMPAVLASAEKA